MAVWQGQILMETRRHQKALQEQRTLADQAEASRFTELKVSMVSEFEKLAIQLQQSQSAVSRELREQTNSLAAMLGEIDDRFKRRSGGGGSSPFSPQDFGRWVRISTFDSGRARMPFNFLNQASVIGSVATSTLSA